MGRRFVKEMFSGLREAQGWGETSGLDGAGECCAPSSCDHIKIINK